MRPLRIYLKNFMNHHLTEVDCTNFQSVLIVGKSKNNDRVSNGVGKTTIFRGIEYALFNQSHATTLDKIVRDGKKKAIVEFDFELNGNIYRIYRHRTSTGSADARLYKKIGTEFESISERTPSATDAAIRNLIKISHKAFTYSVLFRQADLTGITSVTDPKKRKEVLKEPLNLATYTKLEEMAVDKRRPVKKRIDNIEGSINIIGNPEEDINTASKELETNEFNIKEHYALIENNNEIIKQKTSFIEDLKSSLDQNDIDIHRKVSEKKEDLSKLIESAKHNGRKLSSLSDLISSKESNKIKNEQEIDNVNKKLLKLSEYNGQNIEEIQVLYDKICADEVKGSEMISAVKAQMKLTEKSLPDSDECPTCHQDITTEYRLEMERDVNEKLKKQLEDIEFLEDAMIKCKRKKTKVGEELNKERERQIEIEKLELRSKSLGKEHIFLKDEIDRLYLDQKETSKNLKDDESKSKEMENSLNSLKETAVKSNSPVINKKIFEINEEISNIKEHNKSLNKRISNLSSVKGALEERIRNRSNDKLKLSNLHDELIKSKRELKIRQMVVDAFSNRGIPSFIIQTILDDLQFEANAALKELRPELDVNIDADLNFEYRRNGIVKDYAQLSHGQHVYIALAFKRGMAKVIQHRIGLDIKLLEFDEVDAHLDEAGVDAFADAIRKWQKNFTIFVVTHNKDLKDKFSHAILVEEGDDGASGRLVTAW